MKQMISVITLGVADLERSRAFYATGLEWTPFKTGDIVMFKTPTVILSLFPTDELAKDAALSAEGSGFRGVTVAYCARSQNEVNEALESAARAGGSLIKPAQRVFWGGYSGYFADPDGHLWEVAFHEDWLFDEEGRIESL